MYKHFVFDIDGTLIEQKEIVDTYQQVDLPTTTGLYIVYIYSEGKVYQRKIIVP